MFTRQPQLALMTYSDGTWSCEPNICTHDLSCFPQGLSAEKYSDTIVSAHVRCARRGGVCVYAYVCAILQAHIHNRTRPFTGGLNGITEPGR